MSTDYCAEFRWPNGVCMHSGHDHDRCTCNEAFAEPACPFHVRVIGLPAINKSVTIAQYCKAVKRAKANTAGTFPHGLTTWWPTPGAQIVQQFREGMHDRINRRGAFT